MSEEEPLGRTREAAACGVAPVAACAAAPLRVPGGDTHQPFSFLEDTARLLLRKVLRPPQEITSFTCARFEYCFCSLWRRCSCSHCSLHLYQKESQGAWHTQRTSSGATGHRDRRRQEIDTLRLSRG